MMPEDGTPGAEDENNSEQELEAQPSKSEVEGASLERPEVETPVEDFASMLAEFEQDSSRKKAAKAPQPGEVVRGKVISIGSEAAFVDLGAKSEGMLELDQIRDREGELICGVGDVIEARVVESGGASGVIVLRRRMGGGKGSDAVAELSAAFEHRMPVDGLVAAVIKGGFEVTIAGSRGFCPISQIDSKFVDEPEVFVGQRLSFRITKLESGRGGRANIVVSRRALLEEENAMLAAELRKRLEVGLVTEGTVTTIKEYGAFVDLGGLEGMLHISEIGHTRIGHPSDVLSVGQRVEVQVTKIEPNRDPKRSENISLSLKSLAADPWQDAETRFAVGSRVSGEVVRVQPFGAFVEIAPGVEGLVHISELSADKRVKNPREVVTVGDRVAVTILGVEKERRRISLSIAAGVRSDAEREEAENIAAHSPRSSGLGTFADLLQGVGKKS